MDQTSAPYLIGQETAPAKSESATSSTLSSATVAVNASTRRKKRYDSRPRPDHCLNCGRQSLTTRFCPDCGQENTPHAVSIGELTADILEEFVKWDGRLLRTLGLLLFFPGRLTQEYNAGRRAKYVSPFKMYFVVSALFVFFLSLNGPNKDIKLNFSPETDQINIGSGDTGITNTPKPKKSGISLFGDEPFPPDYKLVDGSSVKEGRFHEAYTQWQKDKKNHKPHPFWKQTLYGNICTALDAPGVYISNLIQSIGKAMFFLLPFYAFLLAVFFFRSRRYYVEHLILAINNHTTAFLIGSIADLTITRFPVVTGVLIFSYWLYELVALRIVYGRSWLGTISRQFMIWVAYLFALIIGFAITAIITLIFP
jgi:hypothetical protein